MDILYLLIPMSVVLVMLIVAAFLWAIRSGQFEDLEGPAHRILLDDDDQPWQGDAESKAAEGRRSGPDGG